MAKRRHSHDEELPFVALMDTMTNVVGVLIIVLVMIGISIANSVKKVMSELPPASVEQLQKIKRDLANTAPVDPAKIEAEIKKMEEQLKIAVEELKTLDTTTDPQKAKMVNLDELHRQLEERKKERDLQREAVNKMLGEADRLKALLDTTPVFVPGPATVVRVPQSKPLPEKARLERYMVVNGKLYYLDIEEAKKKVESEFTRSRRDLLRERTKTDTNDRKDIFDQEKTVAHFANRKLSLRDWDISVPFNKPWTQLVMRLTPKPAAGEPIQSAASLNSPYQGILRRASQTNAVIWFYVARSDFATYLRARELCEASGASAGWEPVWEPRYDVALDKFEVNRMEQPPPAAPVDPNKPKIVPPGKTLD